MEKDKEKSNKLKYYLIGIKGSGMSALAQILADDGHIVMGADVDSEVFTEEELSRHNIVVEVFEEVQDINCDFVVVGHNFMHHKIMEKVKKANVPFMEYHRFLNMYFYGKYQIAVAGTHGKTTTVGLLYQALNDIDEFSMLRGDGVGVGGNRSSVIYEACEYKDHYLVYNPDEIIVTNIDYDHSDYFLTIDDYNKSFLEFIKRAKMIYLLYDDLNKISIRDGIITFGVQDEADYHWKNLSLENGVEGDIYFHKNFIGHISLDNIFGFHNAMHILSVCAVAHQKNIEMKIVNRRLTKFTFIKRRMERKIIGDDVFIDDYAHHPKEIKASIDAVRLMFPSKRVVVVFKPDRLSRLQTFCNSFKSALQNANQSYVLPLYEHIGNKEIGSEILVDEKIKYIDSIDVMKMEKDFHKDTIYLFMSSKNLNDFMQVLENYFQDNR